MLKKHTAGKSKKKKKIASKFFNRKFRKSLNIFQIVESTGNCKFINLFEKKLPISHKLTTFAVHKQIG